MRIESLNEATIRPANPRGIFEYVLSDLDLHDGQQRNPEAANYFFYHHDRETYKSILDLASTGNIVDRTYIAQCYYTYGLAFLWIFDDAFATANGVDMDELYKKIEDTCESIVKTGYLDRSFQAKLFIGNKTDPTGHEVILFVPFKDISYLNNFTPHFDLVQLVSQRIVTDRIKKTNEENPSTTPSEGFDIVLKESQLGNIDADDALEILSMLHKTGSQYMIEIEGEHSVAAGFIAGTAAEKLYYDYEGSGLNEFVANILNDMDNESEDGTYVFHKVLSPNFGTYVDHNRISDIVDISIKIFR